MDETMLDGVLYKWACDTVLPMGGTPSNEYEVRMVHNMMTHGVKLLQLSQAPAAKTAKYDTFKLEEFIDRVKELAWAWRNGKSEVAIGMRMNNIENLLKDFDK